MSQDLPHFGAVDEMTCTRCGQAHESVACDAGDALLCTQCGHLLENRCTRRPRLLAVMAITGLFLFLVANVLPIVTMSHSGYRTDLRLIDSITALWTEGRWFSAAIVGFTLIAAPVAFLVIQFAEAVCGCVRHRGLRWPLPSVGGLMGWAMLDVYVLSILVSLVKLMSMAVVDIRNGFIALIACAVTMLAMSVLLVSQPETDADDGTACQAEGASP